MKIIIEKNKKFGKFEGFGASGAWWAQEVGGWENIDSESNLPVKDKIAQLLYSKTDGIGLRTYRYNIGAGSAHSGNGSIDNRLRRTESFDCGDGLYDFSRDKNAVYMMEQSVKYGADEVIFFVNSPIERLTKNGWSHLGKNQIMRDNLAPENYKKFADYCLDVTEHFVKKGLPVKYLSPINEPIWIWNGGQEGCHYSPRSAAKVMRVFADEMNKRPALASIKLSGMESGDIRWFNKSFTRALMKYASVRKRTDSVDVHSYFLNALEKGFFSRTAFLKRYRRWLDKKYPSLPVKMSEWCHMQGGRDTTMASALVCARIIFEDISILNVSSWQHWIAVSEVDYCDGLIYINLDDKTFQMTKRYYVTGNFSKYIPYNAEKTGVHCDDTELKILAFTKDTTDVLVIINDSENKKSVSVPSKSEVLIVVTDKDCDLYEQTVQPDNIQLTAKSVTTIVIRN